jgi:hypothetical protein
VFVGTTSGMASRPSYSAQTCIRRS